MVCAGCTMHTDPPPQYLRGPAVLSKTLAHLIRFRTVYPSQNRGQNQAHPAVADNLKLRILFVKSLRLHLSVCHCSLHVSMFVSCWECSWLPKKCSNFQLIEYHHERFPLRSQKSTYDTAWWWSALADDSTAGAIQACRYCSSVS